MISAEVKRIRSTPQSHRSRTEAPGRDHVSRTTIVSYSSNSGTLEKPEHWKPRRSGLPRARHHNRPGSAGSSEAFETQVTEERKSLWSMGKTHSIALKIALNESYERRIMGLELEAIEFTWKHEEELVHIIDEELTPDDVREQHLRRLPVTVVQ